MHKIGSRKSPHTFANVPSVKMPRSQFNLSHGIKTAFDSGYLIPFFTEIAYPGDTFNIKANCFGRLSTPIVPVMDNIYLDTFWFAAPLRLLWSHFVKFMGEQDNPGDSISYTIPQTQCPASGFTVGSLYDYFGIPTVGQIGGGNQIFVNNLAGRMYNLTYNQWFRDENIINSVTVDQGDGPDTYSNYVILRRGKRKDYFTSCLPWPQKGSTAVTIPLGTTAPVYGQDHVTPMHVEESSTNTWGFWETQGAAGAIVPTAANTAGGSGGNWNAGNSGMNIISKTTSVAQSFPSTVYADLTGAAAATINQLRQSFQIQALLEKDARCGTRYTEIIQGHFGVISDDARLQRVEYLGGGSSPIKINPVAQTSATGATGTPQANLSAYGVVATPPHGFIKSFTEHCLVMGIVNVRCDLNYQQGLAKQWQYQTRYDLYWPAFAHLGEQAVLTNEIYCTGNSGNDNTVFGYQERYAELRYKPSMITGILRSTAASTMDIWHLAQKFTSAPTLNSTFINETPPINRVVAVNTEPQILFDAWIDFKAARPVPMYGIPGQLFRF